MSRADTVVEIVPPDPDWHRRFTETRERLAAVLPDAVIEHIGSTSVPGLASKDTVDVAVGVVDVAAALAPEVLAALARAGFEHVPSSFAEDPDHAFLHRIVDDHRTDHVHVMRLGAEPMVGHLLFRDHLRAHPEVATRYEVAKRELAARYRDERDRYVEEKQAVVESILRDVR